MHFLNVMMDIMGDMAVAAVKTTHRQSSSSPWLRDYSETSTTLTFLKECIYANAYMHMECIYIIQ